MKRFFLAGMLFLMGGSGFGRDLFLPGNVIGERVNIRAGPSLRAEIVGQVNRDQPVEVIASDGRWCAIAPPPGLSAWISAAYLREGAVTGERLNVRSGPGIAYSALAQLDKGARPEVLEKKGDWVRITVPKTARFWLDARYVRLEGVVPTPPPPAGSRAGKEGVSELPPGGKATPFTPASAPVFEPSGAPFLPRSAPSYTPSRVRQIKSYTGYIRALTPPLPRGGLRISYELVRIAPRPKLIGYLTSRTIELDRYRQRRINLWAEEVPRAETPVPLLDVKGIQVLW